jgi:hypothetical protein
MPAAGMAGALAIATTEPARHPARRNSDSPPRFPSGKKINMVDPRGLRFAATFTAIVLAIALITGNAWVLLAQLIVFLVGAVAGVRYAPYGLAFRYLIRPRLGPPTTTEDAAPPRFAQAVGAVFAGVGVAGFLSGISALGYVATAFAFAAAFLNAAFKFCLGCQLYLFFRSITTARGARA